MMKLYHVFIAGRHKLDRIDFFLVERRPSDQLRQILHHFGLHNIKDRLENGGLSQEEAEKLCIIASKLLKLSEVEGLRAYTKNIMGIDSSKFFFREIKPPLDKSTLQDETLHSALQEYHGDGLFLALWGNSHYTLPVKVGGFVNKEAQFLLEKRVVEIDQQFADFVQGADTLTDLLGDREHKAD